MKTIGFILIWVLVTAGVVTAAVSRGGDGERRTKGPLGRLPGIVRLGLALIVLGAVVVTPILVSASANDRVTSGAGTYTKASSERLREGREIFRTTCASCHTLSAAGARGVYGPNLDELGLRGSPERVEAAIKNGGTTGTLMPAGLLEGEDAKKVAEYVAAVAAK
jgi:cytochrome c551